MEEGNKGGKEMAGNKKFSTVAAAGRALSSQKIPDFVGLGREDFARIRWEEKGGKKLSQNWIGTIRVSLERTASNDYKMRPLQPSKHHPHLKSKLPFSPAKPSKFVL
ncbi:hypothetical protein Pyn_28251 [Prunus yedoensis var. nudiflora]|uniref:Uncharacterized protein n=1 Tax=Prunus yedoensis var. nudiflora TaxID=2094558 RepID=A0A314YMB1_PRUYE|nr:hypothetical protein Pyn_28251 [Prunus yedoensis var. nudiflora]